MKLRGIAALLAWLVLALGLPGGAAPAAAQQTDLVNDRDLAYRAARSDYQSALDNWAVVEKRWNDAVEEHLQA